MKKRDIIYVPDHLRCIAIVFLMTFATTIKAQQANTNYVKTITYLDAKQSNAVTSVQYYDGIGRPITTAIDGFGESGLSTLHSFTEYDKFGRERRTWMPVPGTSLDCPDSSYIYKVSEDTYHDTKAYLEYNYDILDRPTSQFRGGDIWYHNGKKMVIDYGYNSKEEVKRYILKNSTLSENGFWPSSSLTKETTTDEDGHKVCIYKNMYGEIILERKKGNEDHDTYYIYDAFGNITYVLTPQYQESEDLASDAYVYKYDNRYRCISKQLPGCKPSTYVYNDKDQLIISSDPLLKEKNIFRVMLYDNYGRLAIQGTTSSYKSTMVNNSMATKANQETGLDSIGYYFCEQLFPEGMNIEMINYYDDYYFFDRFLFSKFVGKDKLYNSNKNDQYSKGSLTGQIVATTDGKMLYNTFYYDQKGRAIDERHSTLDGDVYKITTEYSFTDKPKQTTKVLRYGQPDSYAIETSYQYNQHNDQLAKVTVNHGGKSEDVSEITYNDLGQIQIESRANNADDVEYSYELHGWTKTITSPFFEEELFYADAIYGADSRYNGDISAQSWKVGNKKHAYAFTYDERDMLTNATYSLVGSTTLKAKNRFSESATYNANDGITSLTRRGKNNNNLYSDIDKLTYEYDGNQLKNITDAVGTKLSYKDAFEYVDGHKGTEASPDFEYNGAGMLVKDLDKGISKIIYNNIGLVDSICFSNGSRVKYVYAMTGEKLRVTHYTSNQLLSTGRLELGTNSVSGVSTTASTQTVANVGLSSTSSTSTTSRTGTSASVPRVRLLSKSSETLYIGGDIQVDMNGTYTHLFGGGYSEFKPEVNNADSIKYYYYTKDHLGNIRNVLTQNESGTMTELQHTSYYPFGGIIADLSTGRDVQNRMYNGKEQDFSNNLFWLDYGARQYDPTRGQFTTPDPLAELAYNQNLYMYANNNPIYFIDLYGLKGYSPSDADKNWPNFNTEEDWVDLPDVIVTTSSPAPEQPILYINYEEEPDCWPHWGDLSPSQYITIVDYTSEWMFKSWNNKSTNFRQHYTYKLKKLANKKLHFNIKTKTGEIYNTVIPNWAKNAGKCLTYTGAFCATFENGVEMINTQQISVGNAVDGVMLALSIFPATSAFAGVYWATDIIVTLMSREGNRYYINKGCDHFLGGSVLYNFK